MVAYNTYEDAQLVTLLCSGDHAAFTEIYNRYWERMLYMAGIKYGSVAMAEEIVQEIFLDLWNRREQLQIEKSLGAYLAVAVKYKVINAQAKSRKEISLQNEAIQKIEPAENPVEEWVRFQELRQMISEGINKLPERCRITYQLSREEGLTLKEVASRLNITEKAVEANITRALKLLRTSIKHFLFSFFL